AAARYRELVKTVSLISPVLSYRRTFLHPETEWAREIFNDKSLRALRKTGRLYFDEKFYVGVRFVEEMAIVRPDVALRDVCQPVLIFHGDQDPMVPYEATVEACRGLSAVHLVTMAGIDHGFMAAGDEEGQSQKSRDNKAAIYSRLLEHLKWTRKIL